MNTLPQAPQVLIRALFDSAPVHLRRTN